VTHPVRQSLLRKLVLVSVRQLVPLLAALGLALGLASIGERAFAQQPGDKDPARLPLGEVQPGGRPAGQPQPGQPGGRPAGQPQPGQPGMGRPRPPMPPGHPGLQQPGGMQPRPLRPQAAPPSQPEAAHGHGGHCPGHGPTDSPHAPNWWQGIIGVDNEAAQFEKHDGHFHRTDGFLTQLLWRYENSKDECDPKNQPPPFLASVLNFSLLVWVIYRFGRKPLAEALAARKKSVMHEIDTASRLKEEAETRLADYEDKLENLDETLEQMKKDYVAQGEIERKQVLAEAEERRERMKRDVEFRLQQEAKAVKQQLLQEAVARAVVEAEELIKKRVTKADLDQMANDYLAGLGAAWKGATSSSSAASGSSSHGGAA
jgi:F-type H+-transporting ATPase subunit b